MNHRAALFAILLAACSKHDDKTAATGTGTGTATATATATGTATGTGTAPAPAAAPAADLPTVDKIDCTKAVPQALVDKYFPGAKVTTAMENLCEVASDDLTINLNVEYNCSMTFEQDEIDSTLAAVQGKPVPDLGRGAAMTAMQLHVFDTDSACLLNVSYVDPPPAKIVDFTRELLTHVP